MVEIVNQSIDPYFNIACEEYLLKNFDHDCFMLWRNSPSVIIGKHQNTFAEINLSFIENNGIKIVRRISGGGAVYHDLGNLNFTFITSHNNNKIINFDFYLKPAIELLNKFGIIVTSNKRNNLFIDEKKICGTSAHIFKNKIIHHGTLLFSANIENLENSIKTKYETYTDKSIKSVNSVVTNIKEHLKCKITIEGFTEYLRQRIYNSFNVNEKYLLLNKDILNINKLVETKYKTWEWNFGYSPDYSFSKSTKNNVLNISVVVKKGIITNLKINGTKNFTDVENVFIGVKHKKTDILNLIKGVDIDYVSKEEFIDLFF